ncbi:MAG: peptide chain release factor 1 [Nitrosomonas sp.]|uniref:peptide chain release factor 1 n=1 Tax=Nitrosomonas sp. TaxID=42353 RepID=UPI0027300E77|nr:peptide chain release factor 1 [Nitrosomonas sp.]MDP1548536.1 peptide chain release factor 1 [Nitrosomonas sp.]MDP2224007.1 peptide chain release factor 1 [Nitrosomonas sp.]
MNRNITERLTRLSVRLEELNQLLSSESVTANLDNYRKLTREHSEIVPIVELYRAYQLSERDIQTAREMHADLEMRSFAEAEIQAGKEKLVMLESEIQKQLLPKDPNDERNIFLEIRAGTGGDESALFAGNLFRMYSRFAERRGWQVEIISQSLSDIGGYKEIIAKIIGQGAYSRLKFESGGHRVQRVPATETQGRVHTSTCTVAVMPEADEVSEVVLNPSELRIDTYRASGAGGQHINKTDSAVRITHLPTGIVVECQDGRSQHKNKAQALSVLAARIHDKQMRAQHAEQAATRKSLVGTGERSERIRTYNFPQGRVTDHRINLTLYKMDQIMDGDIDELCSALMAEHQAELLAASVQD